MKAFEVSASEPCVNTALIRDGAYVAKVHYLKGAGIKTEIVKFGTQNPSNAPIAAFVDVLRSTVGQNDAVYKKEKMPMEHLIGFSIVRHCVRDVHEHDMPNPGVIDSPRTERVGAFVIARSWDDIVSIQPHTNAQMRRPSDNGIASATLLGANDARIGTVNLQYLALTPSEYKDHALQAIPTLAAKGSSRDPYVPLHPLPYQDGFVEQIVTLDELQ
jgi:hypothetical protein